VICIFSCNTISLNCFIIISSFTSELKSLNVIEFAKQYIKEIKYIISLDGSWISNELNKQRLLIWKNKGKIIPKINNQKTLDNIIDKIKNEKDNMKYINMIESYIRGTHTKFCIKQNYEKMNIPFIA